MSWNKEVKKNVKFKHYHKNTYREACYKRDRFWCCEFRCEREFRNEREKQEFDTYKKNMATINRVFAEKSQ